MTQTTGRAWRFGANIDTDQIIPSQYLVFGAVADMAAHCMEPQRPEFAGAVKPGDFIVAGPNFGCGSSREQAPLVLKELGVGAIVAPSFARIFFRNAINMGLMPIICPDADAIADGEQIELDAAAGTLRLGGSGKTLAFPPLDDYPRRILEAGGLLNFLRHEAS